MGASDLRVTVDQPKLRCVLDPALVLGHPLGPRLAQRLTRVFETWLTRSFWQVIDSSELLPQAAEPPALPQPDATALREWIALRNGTDAGSWLLRWVGDNLAESQLRTLADDDLVDRFEWLAEALALREATLAGPRSLGWCRGFDPLASALDALALSAALEGALILCPQPAPGVLPWPVQALQRLQLPAAQWPLGDSESLFAAERQLVRQALAGAGLASLLQGMAPLAVVHALPPLHGADPWCQAQAWWYAV